MIKYFLTHSPVSANPDDQVARVVPTEIWGLEELIDECLVRGSTLTKPDLRASIELLFRVMVDKVANGVAINTPLINVKASIGGLFLSDEDAFDRSRHEVRAAASAGIDLKDKLQTALVAKTDGGAPQPKLKGFQDTASQTRNNIATPGDGAVIVGKQLKFDPANPLEGIFFVNDANAAEVKVTSIIKRTDGLLIFNIPALPAGSYKLQVRRSYTQAAEIRSGQLNKHLTVP